MTALLSADDDTPSADRLEAVPSPTLLCRAPALEPPYDDAPSRHLRLVPPGAGANELPFEANRPQHLPFPDEFFEWQPTMRAALPDPGPQAAQLVQAALEVVAGRRPLQQLMPHLSESVYIGLTARLARAVRSRPAGPHLAADRGRVVVMSVRVCEPMDGIAEVAVVARHGERVYAVALRLEGVDGRWRCIVMEIL